MMLIEGEHFNTGSNLFDNEKKQAETQVKVLTLK